MVSKNLQEHWPSNEVNKWTKNASYQIALTHSLPCAQKSAHNRLSMRVLCERAHLNGRETDKMLKNMVEWLRIDNRRYARYDRTYMWVCGASVENTRYTRTFFSLHDFFSLYFTFNLLAFPAENVALRFSIRNLVGKRRARRNIIRRRGKNVLHKLQVTNFSIEMNIL